MRSLFFRTLGLGLRFGCPLFILWLTDANVLGSYYLFTTFFTVAIFFIALELAIPFSRYYLRAKSENRRKKVFTALLISQGTLAIILGLPIVIFHAVTTSMTFSVAVMFYFALVTGAYVNEAGRFFWNIGLGDWASKRNLIETIIFIVAIVTSITLTKEVVGVLMLATMVLCSLILMNYELNKYGTGGLITFFSGVKNLNLKAVIRRVFNSIKESAPQVVHIQILSLIPYIERLLMEKTVGLGVVGSYSFQFSIVQSGASLLLIPFISEVRKSIFKSTTLTEEIENHNKALKLLLQIIGVSLLCGIGSYVFLPILAKIMHKNIEFSIYLLLGSFSSVVTTVYANAVAPFFASRARLFRANLMTLICLLPMLLLITYAQTNNRIEVHQVMLVIIISAALQLMIRFGFHVKGLSQRV